MENPESLLRFVPHPTSRCAALLGVLGIGSALSASFHSAKTPSLPTNGFFFTCSSLSPSSHSHFPFLFRTIISFSSELTDSWTTSSPSLTVPQLSRTARDDQHRRPGKIPLAGSTCLRNFIYTDLMLVSNPSHICPPGESSKERTLLRSSMPTFGSLVRNDYPAGLFRMHRASLFVLLPLMRTICKLW